MSELAPAERALLRLLGRTGTLSAPDVARLSARAEGGEVPVHELAEREGLVTGETLAALLADTLRLRLVDLAAVAFDPAAVQAVSESVATRHQVVPVRLDDGTLELATANPLDADALKVVEFATGHRVRPVVTTRAQIAWALGHAYGGNQAPPPPAPPARAAVVPVPACSAPAAAPEIASDELRALGEALRAEQHAAATESRAVVAEAKTMAEEALRRSAAAAAGALPAAALDRVTTAVGCLGEETARAREELAAVGAEVARLAAELVGLRSRVEDAPSGVAPREPVADLEPLRTRLAEIARLQEEAAPLGTEVHALRAAVGEHQARLVQVESGLAQRLDESELRIESTVASAVESLSESLDQCRRQLVAQDLTMGKARLEVATARRQATEFAHRADTFAGELHVLRERIDALGSCSAELEARVEQRREASVRAAGDGLRTEMQELRAQLAALAARLPEPGETTFLGALRARLTALAAIPWSVLSDAVARPAAHVRLLWM